MKKEFMLGCNYWASHAGTEMWKMWDANVVEDDFKRLSSYGVKYLRVFPNWRDFQPVHPHLGGGAAVVDYRLHDADLPENPYYLDETMLERFGIFCDLAEKYGLKLIVGLITGFMSGRTFLPPALYGKKMTHDPIAFLFQQKLVHGIAERFKDKAAIYAWDLGNECNTFVGAENHFEAENWSMIIANAIKTADDTRPIVSGMHSLTVDGTWRIKDQGAHCDVLTTHPYPYWCSHCSEGEITSIQTLMHATCETKYYSNLGGKPCLAEEIGTMGPAICDDKISGDFMKLNLYSNWANGAEGVLWWCANEQIDLMFPPYDRNMCETELGMFDRNKNAKPVLNEVKKFAEYLNSIDFTLPKAENDAVCLATSGQDQWGVMYSSYVLARQTGVNVSFADAFDKIPDANIYLMPSINGNTIMPAQNYNALKEKVANGATLYVSIDMATPSDFNNLTGITINNSKTKADFGTFTLNGKEIPYGRTRNYLITADRAETIANDKNGMPIFTKYKYGKGTVYFLNFPLEKNAIGVCDAFDGTSHEVYNEIFSEVKGEFAVKAENPYIGMTRHKDDGFEWVTLINYSPAIQKTNATVKDGFKYEVIRGNIDEIEPFEMTIIKLWR